MVVLGYMHIVFCGSFLMKSRSTSPRLENFSNRGFGKNEGKDAKIPFPGISISSLATPGCVYPPTVNCEEDIMKLASPLTVCVFWKLKQ